MIEFGQVAALNGYLVDVSLPVREGMFPIAEASDVKFETLSDHGSASGMLESMVSMSCHAGTHVDYPTHVDPESDAYAFAKDGFADGIFPQNSFTLAYLLDFSHKGATELLPDDSWRWGEEISADEVRDWFRRFEARYPIFPHDCVSGAVLRTGWNDHWFEQGFWRRGGPTLSDEAAQYLMDRGLRYLASDFAFTHEPGRTHDIVLRHPGEPRFLVEGLCNLGAVDGEAVGLLVAPLKLEGREGLPARVFTVQLDLGAFRRSGGRDWHHTSLTVGDLDSAVAFYQEAFGFEVVFETRGMTRQMESITGVSGVRCDLAQLRSPRSGHVLELMRFRGVDGEGDAPLRPGTGHVAFVVEDLEAALGVAERLGAEVLGEVTTFAEGRAVYCREPSGTVFELEELFDDGGVA